MKISGERVHPGMKRPRLSPLRYPGGKSGLYSPIRDLIRANGLSRGTYVEPYAGGAGAALGLLITGEVERIVINDLDPAVSAFWRAVIEQGESFASLVEECTVDVSEWTRQREAYMRADRDDHLTLGFATFYLNRTNRSGVLNGGPIGGHDQTGNYKIDARFNKKTLLERLRLIRLYASKISVRGTDGVAIIEEFADNQTSFIYADPPYFMKAGSLYLNSFKHDDHARLANCLNQVAKSANWILTYDNVPDVPALYPDRRRIQIGVNYSARHVIRAKEILVYSDKLRLDEQSLWDCFPPEVLQSNGE
jgi:DNA adenine methylase